MRLSFPKITRTIRSTGICPICGKKNRRTHTLWQTSNPWNPRSLEEISKDLKKEEKNFKWDFTCKKCQEGEQCNT